MGGQLENRFFKTYLCEMLMLWVTLGGSIHASYEPTSDGTVVHFFLLDTILINMQILYRQSNGRRGAGELGHLVFQIAMVKMLSEQWL